MTQQTVSEEKRRYRIVVRGPLDDIRRAATEGFTIEQDGPDTVLVASIDQATLHRCLDRLYSASLDLVGIRQVNEDRG
jgi:hypothetical protein